MSLSPRALTLIALTFLLGIVGLWSADPTVADLWRWPAALILLALAAESVLVGKRHRSLRLEVPRRAYLGRALPVRVVLENVSRLPMAIEYVLDPPRGMSGETITRTLRVGGREVADEHITFVPRRLGSASWPALRARVLGILGLAWWTREIAHDARVAVAPDLLGAARRQSANVNEGAAAGRAHGSGSELYQLRQYRPGDPLHRIDWKATARRAGLVTREFTQDQHLDVIVALDAGRSSRLAAGALDRLGTFANVAARFAEHAVAHDDRVGLVVYAERVRSVVAPTRGQPAVTRIRSALEALGDHPGIGTAESSPLAAALQIRSLARQRSLVVLLTDLDDVTTGGELVRAVRLLQMKHLVIVAGVVVPEIEQLASATGDAWWEPYRALAAREWLARSRAQLASLRGAGTPAIAARAPDLESSVLGFYERLRRNRRI